MAKRKSKIGSFSSPDYSSCLLPALAAAVIFLFTASAFSQQAVGSPPQTTVKLSSSEFISADGLSVERLIELGTSRRADLLAARQRLAIAEGRLLQAGLRPNPTLNTEYGSARFLGGEPESDFSAGVSQTLTTPQYDPYDMDIKLKDKINAAPSNQRDSIRQNAIDILNTTTINFTNVKKVNTSGKKQKIWSIELFA